MSDGDARLFEAARICREEYCRRVPGKRTWADLSEEEKRVDVECLRAAFAHLSVGPRGRPLDLGYGPFGEFGKFGEQPQGNSQ